MYSTHRFKLILGMGTLLASSIAHAIPSNTVGTFGVNGRLSANYADYTGSNSRTYFKDIESTPDGGLLAAGYTSRADGIYDVLLVKQSQTGALDTSFDSDGKLILPLRDDARAISTAIQPDGKILVLAMSRNTGGFWQVELLRLSESGALDTSFGTNGKYIVQASKNLYPKDMAVTSTGDIIFIYHEYYQTSLGTDKYYTKMKKLTKAGAADTSFTTDFVNVVRFGASNTHSVEFEKISLDASDNIYLTGRYVGVNVSYNPLISMLIAKYNVSGQPENFGPTVANTSIQNVWALHNNLSSSAGSGVSTTNNILNASVILPGGDIVSVGCNANGHAIIQRQTSTGAFVPTFGVGGIRVLDVLPNNECYTEVAYSPSAGLIAIGDNSDEQIMWQFDKDSAATSFSNSGNIIDSSTNNSQQGKFSALGIMENGQIIVAGTTGIPYITGSKVEGSLIMYQGIAIPPATTTASSLSFTSQTNVAGATQVTSNIQTVSVTSSGTVNAFVSNGAVIRNGGGNPMTGILGVTDGDSLELTHTSSSVSDQDTTTSLIMKTGNGYHRNNKSWTTGDSIATFTSTTHFVDTTPDAFVLQPQGTQILTQLSAIATSETITVAGVNGATPVSITNGEYSINGGAYTSVNSTVNNGDTVTVQHTASSNFSTATLSTLDIGGVTATFESTTLVADTTPNSFPIIIYYQGNAPLPNETITFNNVVTVTGINAPSPISVGAGGQYSINGGAYLGSSGTVENNDVISVRYDASAIYSGTKEVGLNVGGVNTRLSSTTAAKDTTPSPFSFARQSGVDLSTTITSAPITVGGINAPSPVSITNGQYSINSGPYTTTPSTVEAGYEVRVRHTSASTHNTSTLTTLTIGGVSSTFVSGTKAATTTADTTPDAFSFTGVTGVNFNTQVSSNTITVTGINAPTPISILDGEYSVNGGNFTSAAGTVNLNDNVVVRHTSGPRQLYTNASTLTIGGIVGRFSSVTRANVATTDTRPDAFVLGALTDVDLNTLVASASITISGINAPADISIVDGEYSINGGAFTSANGTVSVNDEVVVRHTSASNVSSLQTSTLTIGGESSVFSTTTKAISNSTGTVSGASSSGASFGLGWLLFTFLIGLRRVKK